MVATNRKPSPRFIHINDVPAREVVAQMHGERRVGVHLQVLEWTPDRFVAHTKYDPGLVLSRHRHMSDALVFILDGEVQIGFRLSQRELGAMTGLIRESINKHLKAWRSAGWLTLAGGTVTLREVATMRDYVRANEAA